MPDIAVVPPLSEFEDRRTGLMVFGIIVIVLGCLIALMLPLMLVGQLMAGHVPGAAPLPLRLMLPAVFMYLGLAVLFIWLGIGSVLCRRWARALLLVFAWLWLLGGLAGVGMAAFVLPQIFDQPQPGLPPLPPAARILITVFTLATCLVIYVIIPAVLVCFYRSRHVQATCAARDPVPRWTDACPLPVLAISLMLGGGAACMPLLMGVYHSIVPFFGCYLSGGPGTAVLLVTTAAYAWAARATYRLNVAGWWVAFLGFGLWMLSSGLTFARAGLLPMYELMEFPPAMLDRMRQMGFLQSPAMVVLPLVCWLPFLGYLIYLKKFFKPRS